MHYFAKTPILPPSRIVVPYSHPYIRVAKLIHLSTVNQCITGFAYRVVSPRQSRNDSIFYGIRREQKSDHETSCKCALNAHCFHKKQLCLRTLIMEKIWWNKHMLIQDKMGIRSSHWMENNLPILLDFL